MTPTSTDKTPVGIDESPDVALKTPRQEKFLQMIEDFKEALGPDPWSQLAMKSTFMQLQVDFFAFASMTGFLFEAARRHGGNEAAIQYTLKEGLDFGAAHAQEHHL